MSDKELLELAAKATPSPSSPTGGGAESLIVKALELGRAHAKWSVDRSKDAVERRMNQHDVDRIDAAIAAARGVALPDGGQQK